METIQATAPSTFIVTGTNFTVKVQLDEFNIQFPIEVQVIEAASRVIDALKRGNRHELQVLMNPDSKNEKPQVGTVLLVHLAGQNPENAVPVMTHVVLADNGHYKDSFEMEKLFKTQIAELKKKQEIKEKEQSKLQKSLKDFDKLQKEVKKKNLPKKKK